MTWKQTLDYLYSALPMFHRVGAAAYKASLDNTYAICKLTGNPHHAFKCIHIAGTNGKGSVSHALAAILQEAGYKTGLYTSPHLKDFRERIRINGKMISRREVTLFTEKYKDAFEKIKPSFFEMTVGLAFSYFRKNKVDIAVIETGLGGRLDSTNVITPELSIITNISWDHMNLLGDTLQKIAAEKAGIIKPSVPVVIGETSRESKDMFLEKAKLLRAPICFADRIFQVSNMKQTTSGFLQMDVLKKKETAYRALKLDLTGIYQVKNIKTILCSVDMLRNMGYTLNDRDVRSALAKVAASTGLKGRWQLLGKDPLTICDTGHNVDGIKEILRQLKLTKYNRLHWVIGMVNDKEITKILALLPKEASYYFCQARIPRALDATELALQARQLRLRGMVIPSVKTALKTAREKAGKKDLVLVGGSTFVVGEIC